MLSNYLDDKISNIFNDVNLKLESTGSHFKENIILNEYIPNYTFSYYIDTFLRIERIGNKLYFFNDKDIIYVMNDYYMYDSLNNISTDIDYYINAIDNDTYKIDVIVSCEYLKTASYPVVIDPEITVREGGVTDGVFTVTTFDKNTDDMFFLDSGTFTLENRSITTTNDDKVAYFDISILSDDIYLKDDVDALVSSVSTAYTRTAEDFEFRYTEISKDIQAVSEGTDAKFEIMSKYIRFFDDDGHVIIGTDGNAITLKVTNDKILFLDSGIEVAYFSNNKLYVTDGEFLHSLQLGNFAFMPRENGNLSFTKL